jgi:hypothetical protein
MLRILSVTVALFAFMLVLHGATDGAQAQKAQMVKGTIKEVQLDKDVLVVNQKVKNEFVTRELSIETSTEFVVTIKGENKEATGSAGLKLLENAKGASVQVKCDKDVKVLKVTVTVK